MADLARIVWHNRPRSVVFREAVMAERENGTEVGSKPPPPAATEPALAAPGPVRRWRRRTLLRLAAGATLVAALLLAVLVLSGSLGPLVPGPSVDSPPARCTSHRSSNAAICPRSHTSGLISGEWTLVRSSSEIDPTSATVRSRASPSASAVPAAMGPFCLKPSAAKLRNGEIACRRARAPIAHPA